MFKFLKLFKRTKVMPNQFAFRRDKLQLIAKDDEGHWVWGDVTVVDKTQLNRPLKLEGFCEEKHAQYCFELSVDYTDV